MENAQFETLKDAASDYAKKNPIMIYGDYRDELPDDIIEHIMNGEQDEAYEAMGDCEINMQCHESYSYEHEAFREWFKNQDIEEDDITEEQYEEIEQAYIENVYRDYSDFWKCCFNNTRVKLAVTLLKDDGESPINGPHFEHGDDENKEISAYLIDTLGTDGEKAKLCYASEVLKIGGTYDIKTLLEKGMPKGIKIGPGDADNLLFHGSWNGSGSLGSIVPTKEHIFKCTIRHDDKHRYGVDAVYGFTGAWWSHELDFTW